MGIPMPPSHLTLSDIERSTSRSLGSLSLISREQTELVTLVLGFYVSMLSISKEPGSPMTPSSLTSSDLEAKSQVQSCFEAIDFLESLLGHTIRNHIWGVHVKGQAKVTNIL